MRGVSQIETGRANVQMPGAKSTPKSKRAISRRSLPRNSSGASERHAEELMELAVDAAQSRHLPSFLERFVERAGRMLGAEWCGVMVFRGRDTDCYQSGNQNRLSAADLTSLIRYSREIGKEIEARAVPTSSDAAEVEAGARVLVPIVASDGESLGAICLVRAQ